MTTPKPLFGDLLLERDFLTDTVPASTPTETRQAGEQRLVVGLAVATGLMVVGVSLQAAVSSPSLKTPLVVGQRGHEAYGLPLRGVSSDQRPDDVSSRDLASEWNKYLDRLERDGPIKKTQAKAARKLWSTLGDRLRAEPPMPQAGPTNQGSFILVWDRDRHHLEVEVMSRNKFEWFYRDRETGAFEGDEFSGFRLPNKALRRLQVIAQGR